METANSTTFAAPHDTQDDEQTLHITASILSGQQAAVALNSRSLVLQLQSDIAKAFALEPGYFQIFSQDKDLSHESYAGLTLKMAELINGSHVDIVIRSCARPMKVPSSFHLCIKGRRPFRSSAFTIRYNVEVNVPENHVDVQLWRKSDHDSFHVDTQAGVVKGSTQHWMCGDSPVESTLDFKMPLSQLIEGLLGRCKPVFDKADRFWKSEEDISDAMQQPSQQHRRKNLRGDLDIAKCRPEYRSDQPPEWFTAPSADCTELVVNARLRFMTLFRVLLDMDGRPIRAAILVDCPNHDAVEDYDVQLTER